MQRFLRPGQHLPGCLFGPGLPFPETLFEALPVSFLPDKCGLLFGLLYHPGGRQFGIRHCEFRPQFLPRMLFKVKFAQREAPGRYAAEIHATQDSPLRG
jgi:hypothetical protein